MHLPYRISLCMYTRYINLQRLNKTNDVIYTIPPQIVKTLITDQLIFKQTILL